MYHTHQLAYCWWICCLDRKYKPACCWRVTLQWVNFLFCGHSQTSRCHNSCFWSNSFSIKGLKRYCVKSVLSSVICKLAVSISLPFKLAGYQCPTPDCTTQISKVCVSPGILLWVHGLKSLENNSLRGFPHHSLSSYTHAWTRQKSFPRAPQIRPHQSARHVRDLGDNKPSRCLTDQISTYTSATLLLGQDTHPLSTPGLSHHTKLRLDDTDVERGWKTDDQSERRAVNCGKIPA